MPVASSATISRTVKEFSVVLTDLGPVITQWGVLEDYFIFYWPDLASRDSDPHCTQAITCTLITSINPESNTPWGSTVVPSFGPRNTRLVTFDLDSYQLQIPAGSAPWIGFGATANQLGATIGAVESDDIGTPDYRWIGGPFWLPITGGVSVENGMLGIRLTAQ